MADITTDMLDYATNGSNASGFLARPSGDGPFPAVIVVQEWWGVNDNIKDIVRRFANEGFVAFAPDLYHGTETSEPDDAQKLMMQTDMPRASQELVKAAEYLSQQPYVGSIGSTGFCMGGGLALTLATDTPLIKASAPFYGVNPQPIEKLQNLQGPVLAIYAEHDDFASAPVREALQSAMAKFGKQLEVQVYPGTEHAFFNDTRREVYREGAANDAWSRVLTLFRAEL